MYPPGGPRQPEVDFEKILNMLRANFGRIAGRLGGGGVGLLVVGIIALIVVFWAASGIYTISPGEAASLRLFGQVQGIPITETGLHWWWPGPVGKTNVEQVTETKRMELGFRGTDTGAISAFPDEALMISGDLNIVDVAMVVQYNIKNLADFLFTVDDPGEQTPGRAVHPGRPEGPTRQAAAEEASHVPRRDVVPSGPDPLRPLCVVAGLLVVERELHEAREAQGPLARDPTLEAPGQPRRQQLAHRAPRRRATRCRPEARQHSARRA